MKKTTFYHHLSLLVLAALLSSLSALAQTPTNPAGPALQEAAGSKTLIGTVNGPGNYLPANTTEPNKVKAQKFFGREFGAGTALCFPTITWTGPYSYDFARFNDVVNYQEADGKQTVAHLLAGGNNYHPKWLRDGRFTNEELRTMLEQFIRTAIQSNGNDKKVDIWNVVNETFYVTGSFTVRGSKFLQLGYEDDVSGFTGSDRVATRQPIYVRLAFEYARKYTDTKLELRDNNCSFPGQAHDKLLYQLAAHLKNKGTPVDAIGFQTHLTVGQPFIDWPGFKRNVAKYRALGYDVHVTELDIGNDGTAAGREAQGQLAYEAVRACREAGVTLINLWGTRDGEMGSYREGQFALYTETGNLNPKPSYYGIQRALLETADTPPPAPDPEPEPPTPDPEPGNGPVVVRAQGSTGEEQITLLVNGQPTGETVTLTSQMQNYTWTVADASAQVQVQFVNDGNTDDGRDRNVRVDFLQRLGVTEQAKNQSQNSGAWNQAQRQCGGVSSEWLHCQGAITFPARSNAARQMNPKDQKVASDRVLSSPNDQLFIYPNPTEDFIVVKVPKPGEVATIRITDMSGRWVLRTFLAGGKGRIDISGLQPGVYTIKGQQPGFVASHKLIVK